MASSAQRGAYYKARTRKWLLAAGWQVAEMEIVKWIYVPGRTPLPVKRDQFGSDLLAMRDDRLVFIQVKGGASAKGGTFPAARRAFDAYTWPPFVETWVVAWALRAREPRIVVVERIGHGEEESLTGGEAGRRKEEVISEQASALGAALERTAAPVAGQRALTWHGAGGRRATRKRVPLDR